MKKIFLLLTFICLMASCSEQNEIPTVIPVTEMTIDVVSANSVTFRVKLLEPGSSKVTKMGVILGDKDYPSDCPSSYFSKDFEYTITLSDLLSNTTYEIYSYAQNEDGTGRSRSHQFKTEKAMLALSNHEVNAPFTSSVQTVELSANVDWSAVFQNPADSSWLTVTPSSDSGDATVELTTTTNTSPNARTATVVFESVDGRATANLNVVQEGVNQYEKEYFTTVSLVDNNTISCVIPEKLTSSFATYMAYSIDKIHWNTIAVNSAYQEISVAVNKNERVYWKGIADAWGMRRNQGDYYTLFSSEGAYFIEGNIMSLLYGDDYLGRKSLPDNDCTFLGIFENSTHLVDASNLILPATTLADRCYDSMFQGCTSLTSAPALPAATLSSLCYEWMFKDCTSLTTAPSILPATTLTYYCYHSMFYGCTSLTTAPALPATTLSKYCYSDMFYGCTSLTQAPELPATTLAEYCYGGMFAGCKNLTTAPELPATTLADKCYRAMFWDCTSLTQAPELPATTLTLDCYDSMFHYCTSLTSAPSILATTLVYGSCRDMFAGCKSLNYVKCLARELGYNSTLSWMSGVTETGIFVKAKGVSWPKGDSGIPYGWTVMEE